MNDRILRGGEVIDGREKLPFCADVTIAAKRIAAVGKAETGKGQARWTFGARSSSTARRVI